MTIALLLLILGVALLFFGGEVLVDNSVRLAHSFGVSSLVIGLTVVAFATSSPELAATVTASLRGEPEMALGNAFGSNVANLGLILGLSVFMRPLAASLRFIRREVLFMAVITAGIYPLLRNGTLSRLEGILLLALLAFFLVLCLRDPDRSTPEEPEEAAKKRPIWLASFGVAIGIGLLVAGASTLISGATRLAEAFDITGRVVGLTLVALGTSLPELAASLVAARKGQADIVLGGVIGSNIFNLLCILGTTSLITPLPVSAQAMGLDFWVMLGISVLTLALLWAQRRLVRSQGVLLLAIYIIYTIYLFAAQPAAG